MAPSGNVLRIAFPGRDSVDFQGFLRCQTKWKQVRSPDNRTFRWLLVVNEMGESPVAYMLHAGVPRLIQAGLTLHGLHIDDPDRIAIEGYPGLVARSITRESYKSDAVGKQTIARREVRMAILERLQVGDYQLGVQLEAGPYLAELIEDGTGDLLDAVICGLQAAWAWERRSHNFGLPDFDPLEGWIVGA